MTTGWTHLRGQHVDKQLQEPAGGECGGGRGAHAIHLVDHLAFQSLFVFQ